MTGPAVDRRTLMAGAAATIFAAPARAADPAPLHVTTPMAPPEWALLQRELIRAQVEACTAFQARYFDDRHHIRAFERWGANDGPDDAIEAINDWVLLHAIGAPDTMIERAQAIQEGHFEQYGRLRTRETPLGRQGMYVREFAPQMDWQHISEGLTTFNLLGLSTPDDRRVVERTRRFAGFYDGTDARAPNYDPERRLIRSMFNGSLGPLMRPATALDWAGDPFDVSKFRMEHGESSYQETLDHYVEYTETLGDNPLNLHSTAIGLNAFALTGEERHRRWVLDYAGAWAERAAANDGILPSNIGPDGSVGGGAGGRWWGGTYGWGFSPVVPQTGAREDRNRVPRAIVGFMNAMLLDGDDRWMEVWRRQNARINAAARIVDGVQHAPTMHGADGWYGFRPGPYRQNAWEIWYMTMRAEDRALAGDHPWIAFLEGRAPEQPVAALRTDLNRVRARIAAMAEDSTTPETRLADNPLAYNPASVTALLQQTMGALHIARPPWSPTSPNQGGSPLFARLRHFDPERRRAGLPEDVAVLVEALGPDRTVATYVNLNPTRARTIVTQGGAYAEHRIDGAVVEGGARGAGTGRDVTLALAPGSGARVSFAMTRYAYRPTLAFPWSR